jgi:hypothetical protein
MQNAKLWSAVLVVALGACASGSVVPLQNVAESDQKAAPSGVTASDYSAHLDLLALGFDNGNFEVRSPAPHHVLSRGKHGARVVNLALSPDGAQLATVDQAGTLAVSRVGDGELRVLGERDSYARLASGLPGSVVGLAWAPSGRTLAVCAGSLIRLIELDGDGGVGATRELHLKEDVFALTFSPDGSQLVVGGRRLHFLSTAALREDRELEVPADARNARHVRPVSISDLRFNADGTRLGVLLIGGVAFFDVASQTLEVSALRELNPVGLRFAPDGRVAVFGRRAVYVGEPAATKVAEAARATAEFVADVEFRKDGSLLLLGGTADEELAILEWHL